MWLAVSMAKFVKHDSCSIRCPYIASYILICNCFFTAINYLRIICNYSYIHPVTKVAVIADTIVAISYRTIGGFCILYTIAIAILHVSM